MSYETDLHEKDGAWKADAKIAAGVDDVDNTHPLNCTTDGTLEVNVSGIAAPIDVIVDNVVPVSQSGTWTVNLANEPTIDIGKVDQGAPGVSPWPVSEANLDKNFGTWAYYAGVVGTVVVSGGQRILAITCHSTIGGSLSINGGASIPLPIGISFNLQPLGNIVAPTIVFTGTDTYFIEVVS